MRLLLILAIAIMMISTLEAAGVSGIWKGTFETAMGAMENTISLQAGAELTGSVKIGDYEGKIEKASLDGDKISFEINIEPGKVTYEGTVAGDEMTLNVTGTTGNKYNLIAKRQK